MLIDIFADKIQSRPSRARGLKHVNDISLYQIFMSRPSRARGLKRDAYLPYTLDKIVAPFTGAWIETLTVPANPDGVQVAPFTGAWIET